MKTKILHHESEHKRSAAEENHSKASEQPPITVVKNKKVESSKDSDNGLRRELELNKRNRY